METVYSPRQVPDFLKVLAHELRWKILTELAHSDHNVAEITRFLGEPQNVVSYHLRKLREQHVVTERRSSADSRDIYYSLDFETFRTLYLAAGTAVHPALNNGEVLQQAIGGYEDSSAVHVLFLCTKNSARSQMAEGLLRHLSHGSIDIISAGSHPTRLHPLAQRALLRMGIDISQQRSKSLDVLGGTPFDYIITVCDRMREVCPTFSGQPDLIHWSIPDPVEVKGSDEEQYRAFEQTALQLATRVRYLLAWIEREQQLSA